MAYESKDELVRNRQLQVQELCLDFTITASATPASAVIKAINPDILYIATQGNDQITPEFYQSGDSAMFAVNSDLAGTFSMLVNINEPIDRVESAQLIRRDSAVQDYAWRANINGISTDGNKICLSGLSGLPFASPALAVVDLTGQNLGGMTLTPGIYKFDTSAQLTGTLTLNGAGQYIFQIGSTLTTASSAVVTLENGATADNVVWAVGSSATLGTSTAFAGNIFALASVTANTGASVNGRLYALTAAVTLQNNAVTASPGVSGSLINTLMGPYNQFAVLASSTITNTGSSVVTQNLGLYPGTSVTGFPPGVVSGTEHIADATASSAENAAMASYISMQALTGGAASQNSMNASLIVKYAVSNEETYAESF